MKSLACWFALAYLISCGDGSTEYEYRNPAPTPKPKSDQSEETPPPKDEGQSPPPVVDEGPSAEELEAIAFATVVRNCATCHSGTQPPDLVSADDILSRRDRVCIRTGNGSMPPGGAISGDDKAAILEGLGC